MTPFSYTHQPLLKQAWGFVVYRDWFVYIKDLIYFKWLTYLRNGYL